MSRDVRHWCVRRRRVVLTPRRWRQVLERLTLLGGDGGKKARSPGRARISRQTIAQGRPECFRFTCMLVCAFSVHQCTRDRGCSAHPVFPAPSFFLGARTNLKNSGKSLSRERGVLSCRHCEEHLRRSNPVLLCGSGLFACARNDDLGSAV